MSRYLGSIQTSGGAAKGNDEATTFVIPTAAALVLEADGICFVKFHENGTESKVTAGNGRRVTPDAPLICMSPGRNGVAAPVKISDVPSARLTVIPAASDVELKVFERRRGDL